MQGLYLVRIETRGGATPGDMGLNYDGTSIARFSAPTNGYDAKDVNWGPLGLNIPASSVLFEGGIASVVFHFSNRPGRGAGIATFRRIRLARTDGAAVTAGVTVSYDTGPGKPTHAVVENSTSTGRVQYPATGALQENPECSALTFEPEEFPAPDIPPTVSLTLTLISDAAQTLQALVGY
jgi:hypothetical protein